MYKGGVGVKGELSWESWWEEEQVCPKFCILMYYRILYWLVFLLFVFLYRRISKH